MLLATVALLEGVSCTETGSVSIDSSSVPSDVCEYKLGDNENKSLNIKLTNKHYVHGEAWYGDVGYLIVIFTENFGCPRTTAWFIVESNISIHIIRVNDVAINSLILALHVATDQGAIITGRSVTPTNTYVTGRPTGRHSRPPIGWSCWFICSYRSDDFRFGLTSRTGTPHLS